MNGETSSGFKYELSESNLSNYELIEVLADVDNNPLLLPKTVRLLLGEEQTEKLKDHVRLKNGTVPIDNISKEIIEIFNSGKIKN